MNCSFGTLQSTCNIIFDENIALYGDYTSINFIYSNFYNGRVTLPKTLKTTARMFSSCNSYNAPVLIPENVLNCYMMFAFSNLYNTTPIFGSSIANSKVIDCAGMFYGCNSFNPSVSNIKIPDTVLNVSYMFYGCQNFNIKVDYGNNVTRCDYMFAYCKNFNQPVNIPDGVTNCDFMLQMCPNFNRDIVFGNGIINGVNFFANWRLGSNDVFNGNITIGKNMNNCVNFLYMQNAFNANVIFLGNYIDNATRFFWECHNFNQPVVLPDEINNAFSMFGGCHKLNCPITLPNKGNNFRSFFGSCYNLNQSFNIGNISDCSHMFYACENLNSPVNLSNGIFNCNAMFSGCENFNQSIVIPDSVEDCSFMFAGCSYYTLSDNGNKKHYHSYLNKEIIIGNNVKNCYSMLSGPYSYPIIIPDSVEDCAHMFTGSRYMSLTDSQVKIGNNVKNCFNMFFNGAACANTAETGIPNISSDEKVIINMTIPEGVLNCANMFSWMPNCIVDLTIPSSVENASSIVRGKGGTGIFSSIYTTIEGDIYVQSSSTYIGSLGFGGSTGNQSHCPIINIHLPYSENAIKNYGLEGYINGTYNWANEIAHQNGWYSNFTYVNWGAWMIDTGYLYQKVREIRLIFN